MMFVRLASSVACCAIAAYGANPQHYEAWIVGLGIFGACAFARDDAIAVAANFCNKRHREQA